MADIKDILIIDLDNTLTQEDSANDYSKKVVNKSVAISIKNAVSLGYGSTIFSARNMRTFKDDLSKIESITRPIAETWLKKNNIDYEELILGKPWCGHNGWYLDDKNISIEEFIFKFSGPYWNQSVSVLIPFFNEENNILKTHTAHKKIEKLLNVTHYIYVDNGSTDNTLDRLEMIAEQDKKVKIITIDKNMGYGHGIKSGLQEVSSDIVLLNHGDLQFDPYSFLLSNLESLSNLNKPLNIFPKRLNRPFFEKLNSYLLRLILSVVYLNKIPDFNGQPKLILKNKIKNINFLPENFCIDLALYNLCKYESVVLPIIQKERLSGESSWSKNLYKRIIFFLEYIRFAFQNRKYSK